VALSEATPASTSTPIVRVGRLLSTLGRGRIVALILAPRQARAGVVHLNHGAANRVSSIGDCSLAKMCADYEMTFVGSDESATIHAALTESWTVCVGRVEGFL
jgi:hypothetical protein